VQKILKSQHSLVKQKFPTSSSYSL